jgi:hypothetical protein
VSGQKWGQGDMVGRLAQIWWGAWAREAAEEGIGNSSSAVSNTEIIEHNVNVIEAEELNFESSAELGDEALNEFWDLWDIQKELQDLIEIENIKEKSVVEQPD